MRRILLVAAVVAGFAPSALAAASDPVDQFYDCVRAKAKRLEPSDTSPDEIAKAAVMLCTREELNADAAVSRVPHSSEDMRATSLYVASVQVVIARLCRRTGDCIMRDDGLAPAADAAKP